MTEYYFDPINETLHPLEEYDPPPQDNYIHLSEAEYLNLLEVQMTGRPILLGPSGRPENAPSIFHTLKPDGSDWEILPENQPPTDHELANQEMVKLEEDPLLDGMVYLMAEDAGMSVETYKIRLHTKIKDLMP
jgi:hypothetical protein